MMFLPAEVGEASAAANATEAELRSAKEEPLC